MSYALHNSATEEEIKKFARSGAGKGGGGNTEWRTDQTTQMASCSPSRMEARISERAVGRDDTYVVSQCCPGVEEEEEEEEDGAAGGDAPAVFLCARCRRPVGDSLSWAGSDDERNQILLKLCVYICVWVNDNVAIGKEPFVSSTRHELGCLVVNLTCRGCGCALGLIYTSTPKALDYKRSLFCFSVENIESYVLGSCGQQMAAVNADDRPVTLEYQEEIEQQMTK
ncbi:hypothetical protein P4O66_005617, partial [Electrophorus voltai]